jgi:hypothetical protein
MEGIVLYLLIDVMFSLALLSSCDKGQSGRQAQTFTKTFASISAEDRGSRLICNDASLPDYTALQLATQ